MRLSCYTTGTGTDGNLLTSHTFAAKREESRYAIKRFKPHLPHKTVNDFKYFIVHFKWWESPVALLCLASTSLPSFLSQLKVRNIFVFLQI